MIFGLIISTVTTSKQQLSWVLHEDCVAEDCHLREPLPFSKLSPNLLLVFIHASAWRRDRRDAIRKTWLSGLNNQPNSPIQFRFVYDVMCLHLDHHCGPPSYIPCPNTASDAAAPGIFTTCAQLNGYKYHFGITGCIKEWLFLEYRTF